MITDLEETAARLVEIGQTISRCERHLEYGAKRIAELAADAQTDSPQFRGEVDYYRTVRDELLTARTAYTDVLNSK
ncbi:hypothetical protein KTJ89_11180 [Brevibacterium sediminis]|uniref:hypothetical protein n=1 Tax=Brevibacterium sediminis TaxID=1857024 RepID=UPI002175371C|nr:hypothetical protein [Brevibacterium sediminis]MCS4593543.1 hypothetical protein [Brevibacterium sediminis]